MRAITTKRWVVLGISLLMAGSARAQISISLGTTYNVFADLNLKTPLSGDISSSGDVFIEHDLEMDGELYLNKIIVMDRDETPFDEDQAIWFADDGEQLGEQLLWDDSLDAFRFSDDLILSFAHSLIAGFEGTLGLQSQGTEMTFLVDSTINEDLSFPHLFIWYIDGLASGNRVMQLTSNQTGQGNLFIDGQLTENVGFDVAEAFWSGAAIEPGTLVAVDPRRPDGIVPTEGSYDSGVVGVVSTSPGIVLGGHAFSVEKLRAAWGDEVVADYEAMRPSLEQAVYAESPGLRARRDQLYSEATWSFSLQQQMVEDGSSPQIPDKSDVGAFVPAVPALARDEITETYEKVLADHRMVVDDAVMQRFFAERVALVALAGRVPVKVDASFGPILAGDPLTASPTPGVAMKADRASVVVGTALESATSGEETIMLLVDRDWYPGDPARLANLTAVVEKLARAAGLPEADALLARAGRE